MRHMDRRSIEEGNLRVLASSAAGIRKNLTAAYRATNSRTEGVPRLYTRRVTGTAMLAALVVVFDYTLKFSGLKIPFPWLPFLKFDFTGVPISLSLLLYGLSSGATTSIVASLAILVRSGDLVGATMKAIAEFSTVSGIAIGLRLPIRWRIILSVVAGAALRIATQSLTNLIVLPVYYGMPYNVAVGLLPMIGVFNAIQGTITVLLGYLLYMAYVHRVGGGLSA
jgi:riboflavin transporter FmnP